MVSVPNQLSSPSSSSLPILSLADYTTSRGVPTATALANQAKLTPRKQEPILENNNDDDNDDDTSMSIDEYNQRRNDSNSTIKSRRGKKPKSIGTSKTKKSQSVEPIQYGPILVKPRKRIAPTLSSGRKSKDEPVRINSFEEKRLYLMPNLQLPPEEDIKRKQRRDRNKQAAAKCRKRRNELREELEKVIKHFWNLNYLFFFNRLNNIYLNNKKIFNVQYKIYLIKNIN